MSRTVDDTRTSLGPGQGGDARADVYSHPGDIVTAHFDLAGVNTHPNLDAEHPGCVDKGVGARDRGAGAGEGRDESVTGGVHFEAAEPFEFVTHDGVVVVQQVPPSAVAEHRGALGRADDVGEHDGGEHPLGAETAPHASDELLDLVEHRCAVAGPIQGVGAGKLDEARSADVLGKIAAVGDQG
jgi:hypothetical protein